jgi:hypothetical protein
MIWVKNMMAVSKNAWMIEITNHLQWVASEITLKEI